MSGQNESIPSSPEEVKPPETPSPDPELKRGFIVLPRKIQNSWVWGDGPFSKAQAWIDLILNAEYKDHSVYSGNVVIEAKRGDVLYGLEYYAKRWSWGKASVGRFKKVLINEGMVIDVSHERRMRYLGADSNADPLWTPSETF